MRYGFFLNHGFPIRTFVLWKTRLAIQYKVWENHDFKNAISYDCICNPFENLKDYCKPPYLLML